MAPLSDTGLVDGIATHPLVTQTGMVIALHDAMIALSDGTA